MTKYQVLVVVLLQAVNFSFICGQCIFLTDCPAAVKYIERRRNDPDTRKILQNAHCGLEDRGRGREPKVLCNTIPELETLPAGCVYLNECPEALELIRTRKYDPEVIELLRSSTCGYSRRRDMILCNNFVPRASVESKVNLLPKQDECGLQMPGSKIVNGERAEFEDFPWIALFKYKNESGHISYRCHGSLISKRYVVTAAHCVSLNSAQKRKLGNINKVVLGEYDITTTKDCLFLQYGGYCTDPIQEISPESIHVHPSFGSNGALSDIALIRLTQEAAYSDFVRPICLPFETVNLKPREWLFVGGWGKTENKPMSNIKLKARINYLSKEDCAEYSIDDTQICAGSPTGADTCNGDSGGPLMVNRQSADRESRTILTGVVSFGGQCGSGTAIYTNVTIFVKWILDTIHA